MPKTAAAHPRYPQGTEAAQQLLGWAKPPLALTQTMGGLGQPPSRAPASTKFSSGPFWPWSILSMLWQLPHLSHRLAGSTACPSTLLARGAPAPGLVPQPCIPVTNAPQELSPRLCWSQARYSSSPPVHYTGSALYVNSKASFCPPQYLKALDFH